MTTLTLPVERLREGPMELEVDLRPDAIDLIDEEYKFTGRVTGRVVFQMVGNDVLGRGALQAHAQSVCGRCLAPARLTLSAKVEELWMHNEPEEEVDREYLDEDPLTRSYKGDEIELDEALRELIMAELPERPLCRPDCKGLCPGCGADLNNEPCHCDAEQKQAAAAEKLPEWKQALKKLRLDPND